MPTSSARTPPYNPAMWEALALLVLVLGGLLWADSLKARERAVKAGRSAPR